MEIHEAWRSEIPLIVDGLRVGHIRVAGGVGAGSMCEWMSELIMGLKPFEDQLVQLIESLRAERLVAVSVAIAGPTNANTERTAQRVVAASSRE